MRNETQADITGSLWKRGSPLFMKRRGVHAYEYDISELRIAEKIASSAVPIVHLSRDKLIQFAS